MIELYNYRSIYYHSRKLWNWYAYSWNRNAYDGKIKNAYIGLFISLFVIVGLYFLSPLGSLNMINIINPLTYRDPTMIITGTSSFPYSIGMIVLLIYNVLFFVLNRKVFNVNYYE